MTEYKVIEAKSGVMTSLASDLEKQLNKHAGDGWRPVAIERLHLQAEDATKAKVLVVLER